MGRGKNSTAGIVCVFCGMALLFVAAQSFGVVTNEFFDSSLLGWNYNNAGGVVWSSTGFYDEPGNGTALLQQFSSDNLPSSILWQTFYVDSDSSSLLFQVRTPLPLISETDHLYIQLLDSVNNPLLGNSGKDYFFHWKSGKEFDADPDVGWIQSETPTGISISEDYLTKDDNPDWDYLLYSFDIPVAPDWLDKNVTLQFTLKHDYNDGSDTSILVDNVQLVVVPVPAAISLAILGLAGIRLLRKILL